MTKYIVTLSEKYFSGKYPGWFNKTRKEQEQIRHDEMVEINKNLNKYRSIFITGDSITITPVEQRPLPFKVIRSAGTVAR